MTFQGKGVFEIRVPLSGIGYSAEFEWREAAHWANIPWHAFRTLDGDEQAAIVAHYRARMRLDAVIAQDLERRRNRP